MRSYKQKPLIPGGPAKAGSDVEATAEPTGSPPASPAPTRRAANRPPAKAEPTWRVTDYGLESANTAGDPPRVIEYAIEKERLLKARQRGVSDWALQLASKSWVKDPHGLVDAIADALRTHHPGQTAIDVDATREAAVREWRRTHARAEEADPLGYEYVPGEPTLHAVERRRAAAAADAARRAGAAAADDAWLARYPAEHRALLRRHGVDPAGHPDAHHVNDRLVELALAGATEESLAKASDELVRAYVLEEEAEDELPDEFYDWVQEKIDLARGK
jgi:hypothetical protein